MPKRFTLAEAESLLSDIEAAMHRAVELKAEFDQAAAAVQGLMNKIMVMGGMVVDSQAASHSKSARDAAAGRLKSVFEEVQAHGCLIKDLDMGLVDFPTTFEGREVYLCWKLGEKSIEFWHSTDEGFASRKPIDRNFRDNHQGDPVQ